MDGAITISILKVRYLLYLLGLLGIQGKIETLTTLWEKRFSHEIYSKSKADITLYPEGIVPLLLFLSYTLLQL